MKKIRIIITALLEIITIPIVVLLCFLFRFFPKKVDVGMGPLPMISYMYWAKALKRKGYTVETFAVDPYFITDEFDFIIDNKRHFILRKLPVLLFLWSASRYSIMYIFFNGGPLMWTTVYKRIEPYLYKLAKVKMVVSPYGADVQVYERTRNKVMVCASCKDYPGYFRRNHLQIAKQIDQWTRNGDIIVGAMDSIDYLWFWNRTIPCHFAIDTDKITPLLHYENRNSSGNISTAIKILHAPNHTNTKGTKFVEDAIDKLISEGYCITYRRIQNLPNEEVIKIIKDSDIIIDQLVIGWYAQFSMEAMACGKPCICYLRDDLVDSYVKMGCLKKDEIPLISASTDTIYDVLKELLEHKEDLEKIGRRSREYVVRYHSLDAIGSFFAEINSSVGIFK